MTVACLSFLSRSAIGETSTNSEGMEYDRILITGGSGMLAHALDHTLRGRGQTPVLLGRAACDITDAAALQKVFAEVRPTLVFNCAAHTKVDLCESEPDLADAINGHAAGTLAKLCKHGGAALVHFSTDYVFDGTLRRPLRPDDPTGPMSAYGRSKLLGEQLIRLYAPERFIIARTAWLYGPGGPSFPATMVNLARQGKPLKIVADQEGSPTYTFDLAAATLDLLDAGAGGVWHLSNSGQTNWHDFTAAILEEFGLSTDLSKTTSAEWKSQKPDSATRPAYSVLDVAPYEALVGRPMPNWRDGLRRYHKRVAAG